MRGLPIVLALLAAAPAVAQEAREPQAGEQMTVSPRKSPAEIRAEMLDRMLARLHRVADSDEARRAEEAIWKLWMSADSSTAETLLAQATKAMGRGEAEASLGILDTLVEVYPGFAEAWNKRATLYFMLDRYEESLADIEKVLDLEPRHFGALSGRGMIYQRQKKYAAALEAYRDALAINPNMQSVKEAIRQLERIEQPI